MFTVVAAREYCVRQMVDDLGQSASQLNFF